MVRNSEEDWTLFNLKEDFTESNDLLSQYPSLLKDLIEKYNSWEDKIGVRTANNEIKTLDK